METRLNWRRYELFEAGLRGVHEVEFRDFEIETPAEPRAPVRRAWADGKNQNHKWKNQQAQIKIKVTIVLLKESIYNH